LNLIRGLTMADSTDLEQLVVQLSVDMRGYVNAMNAAQRQTAQAAQNMGKSFDDAFARIERGAAAIGNSIGIAFSAVSAAAVVRELGDMADSWTQMESNLKAAGVAQDDVNGVMRELVDIATQTRSPLEGTITLYSRLMRATKDLGLSQKELAQFVKT